MSVEGVCVSVCVSVEGVCVCVEGVCVCVLEGSEGKESCREGEQV